MAVVKRRPIPPLAQKDVARFWSHVEKNEPDVCWLWQAALSIGGYGRFAIHQITYPAHRTSYVLAHGADPGEDMSVLHSCNRPACVNPLHLRIGTLLENNQQREAEGRGSGGDRHWTRLHPEKLVCPPDHPFRKSELKQGELHPKAKLKTVDVLEIRRSFAAKEATTIELAQRFAISRSMIYQVLSRRSWTHLPAEPVQLLLW